MREYEVLNLGNLTTGAYVDTQGFIGHGGREVKFVLLGSASTTTTAGGSVQAAQDTAGTGLTTVATFAPTSDTDGQGVLSVAHGVLPAAGRYVRALNVGQSAGVLMIAVNRYTP